MEIFLILLISFHLYLWVGYWGFLSLIVCIQRLLRSAFASQENKETNRNSVMRTFTWIRIIAECRVSIRRDVKGRTYALKERERHGWLEVPECSQHVEVTENLGQTSKMRKEGLHIICRFLTMKLRLTKEELKFDQLE